MSSWPTTGTVHGFIGTAIELAEKYDLTAPSIQRVHVHADEYIRTFNHVVAKRLPEYALEIENR